MAFSLPHPEKILRSSTKETEFNTLETKFGNGYGQAVANGLNSVVDTWNITWGGLTLSEKDTVEAALRLAGGHGVFTWTPNYESSVKKFKLKSKKYSLFVKNNNVFDISVDLYQVFEVF